MSHTVFILGNDVQRCKDLGDILTDRYAVNILTDVAAPEVRAGATAIVIAEEREAGDLYRRLLNRFEGHVKSARLPDELVQLSSTLPTEEILERMAGISTEVRGLDCSEEMYRFIEKQDLSSLIAVPIRSMDGILGAFISVSTGPRTFSAEDLTTAAEFSNFTAIALDENER
jgi:hypothetical protein